MSPNYDIGWTVSWWRDDGFKEKDEGSEWVTASSESEACAVVENRFREEIASPLLHWQLRVGDKLEPSTQWHRGSSPDPERLRDLRRSGLSSTAIVRELKNGAADWSVLQIMMGFMSAFDLAIAQVAALATWSAAEIDGEELDRVLGPPIEQSRPRWTLPAELRTARESGSVSHYIRERIGSRQIEMIRAVREAFSLSLRDAIQFVDACTGDASDAELDAELEQLIEKNR